MRAKSILKQFLLPRDKNSSEVGKSDSIELFPNDSLHSLYANWHLPGSHMLPLYNPTNISPYEFHSRFNSDQSYKRSPRLSVTKLLTDRWCELSEYYTIYAGSPQFKVTNAITQGLERHSELEYELHQPIDISLLMETLSGSISDAISHFQATIKDVKDPDLLSELDGNPDAAKLAMEWSDHSINRLFSLITTSEAREVLVHGFLNLENSEFVSSIDELKNSQNGNIDIRKVLVSGIVDHFKIENLEDPTDLSLFREIRDYMDYYFDTTIGDKQVIDLTKFLQSVKQFVEEHKSAFSVKTTDVKTRSVNRLPSSISVLEAAKFQTFYYRKMFGLLSNEHQRTENNHFAYYSLLENARVRGIDVDEPLDIVTLVSILRKNYNLFYLDFVKLANGEPIGFEPFDSYNKGRENTGFALDSVFGIAEKCLLAGKPMQLDLIEKINSLEDFNYDEILSPDLIKNWKTAPTLRYLAARCAQFYELFSELLGDHTAVEYHNGRTSQAFHTSESKYTEDVIGEQTRKASTFWNGKRFPIYTRDLSKCNYCDFKPRCMVPNHQLQGDLYRKSLGAKINEFLHS
uniref:Exonuclease V, mitochondrial n=2 Tax=Scheffersomyces stipitis (strain ATCC 58785 / CBS 6054 / NBRC 10063 / NRRL Y-11545) TaxID=322104 RepID=EXO5_PICST|nr:RecName: Full=Exonuclease V, mitochondrial; Short=Exo V; AltName: Full=Defects in morphology protein 1; Flags: Precursor [Scheffersomyces stipitis CBS 6054]